METTAPMRPYQRKALRMTRPVSSGSEGSRGGRSMTSSSGASQPRPSAGSMSVPRSIVRICIVVSGSGTAPPENR